MDLEKADNEPSFGLETAERSLTLRSFNFDQGLAPYVIMLAVFLLAGALQIEPGGTMCAMVATGCGILIGGIYLTQSRWIEVVFDRRERRVRYTRTFFNGRIKRMRSVRFSDVGCLTIWIADDEGQLSYSPWIELRDGSVLRLAIHDCELEECKPIMRTLSERTRIELRFAVPGDPPWHAVQR